MFAVSYKWIIEILNKNISFDEILRVLNLQGFEVKSIDDLDDGDHIITIEVKANRPDMLSHFGVAREIASFLDIHLEEPTFDVNFDSDPCDISINIDSSICDCYYSACINGIDNSVDTPEYIKHRLSIFGIDSINPVVDISNYVSIEYGQPSHIYDRDNINGNCLSIYKNDKSEKFVSLAEKELELTSDDVVIKDSSGTVCVAGIIGSSRDSVSRSSKNIMIESAVFSKIPIRMTSKRLKISTLSSFRFERGVDSWSSLSMLNLICKKIQEICGGKLFGLFKYKSDKLKQNKIDLRVDRSNNILGISLTANEMVEYLNKYLFCCEVIDNNNISVSIPSFRLDIEREIDLIEEIARSFGYDNIDPRNLCNDLVYRVNNLHENIQKLRSLLVGFGFNEVINYAFVPESMAKLFDHTDHVILQNPLSNLYSLMRTEMIYSLLSSLVYNYSIGNYDDSLSEIGRTYHKNDKSETLVDEIDSLGFIISGNKINSGFGVTKSIKYNFYDLTSYIINIFNEFNQQIEYKLKKSNYLENSYDIISNNESVGFFGIVSKNKFTNILPNVKLIKNEILYCELNINKIKFDKKVMKFKSEFPSIVRQYNLICKKTSSFKDISKCINSFNDSINEVSVKDVYEDSKMSNDEHSLLIEIKYRLESRTLSAEEVEKIESDLLSNLSDKFGMRIKM